MRFPATSGWVWLHVVVGARRHSWLRALGAVPRHSSLGSAGGSGVSSLATPGCGSWLRFPATPGLGVRWWRWWVGPCHSWLRVLVGCTLATSGCGSRVWFPATPCWGLPAVAVGVSVGGGFPCCGCLWRGACAWCLCWCVWCVFVVSVMVVVRLWVCLPRAFVCVCVCVCGVLVAYGCRSLLPLAVARVSGGVAVVGPSPLLAEVFVCDSPQLLTGFRCRWWWVFLTTPG